MAPNGKFNRSGSIGFSSCISSSKEEVIRLKSDSEGMSFDHNDNSSCEATALSKEADRTFLAGAR